MMYKDIFLKFFFLKFLFTFHVFHVNGQCTEEIAACREGCYWGGSKRTCGKGCGDVYICLEVGPGYYSGIENARHECSIGTYAPLNKNEQCTSCEPGTYQDLLAQSECKTCPEGTYQPDYAQSSCLNCPPGSYNDNLNSISCQPCSDEVYSGEGSTTFFVDTNGNKICILNPAMMPSSVPTQIPSSSPSLLPTLQSSTHPSALPSYNPSSLPTLRPSIIPSSLPSSSPSSFPTLQPSIIPSTLPSSHPSMIPTSQPSIIPSTSPSLAPSLFPTLRPSIIPSLQPSLSPTAKPSIIPSLESSLFPTFQPSILPSLEPSLSPTVQPSIIPSLKSSLFPTVHPSIIPSLEPSLTPSLSPTAKLSILPSLEPSSFPTVQPSILPSLEPSSFPTVHPSSQHTGLPSLNPSSLPTLSPSIYHSSLPSSYFSLLPTMQQSITPSDLPSSKPSLLLTLSPSIYPSSLSSLYPTMQVSMYPSVLPSLNSTPFPTKLATSNPSSFPSLQPSLYSSNSPSSDFSLFPTLRVSFHASNFPSLGPSSLSTLQVTTYSSGSPSGLSTLRPSVKGSSLSSISTPFSLPTPSSIEKSTSPITSTLHPTSSAFSKLSEQPSLSIFTLSSTPSQASSTSIPSSLSSISSETRDIISSSLRECQIGYTGNRCNECCDVNHHMIYDDEGSFMDNSDCLITYDKNEKLTIDNLLSSENIRLPRFSSFFRQGKGQGQSCVECPKHTLMVIAIFLITIAALMVLLKMFATMNLSYGLLFISIDYLQIVSFLNVTMVQWPEKVTRIFTLLSVFRFDNIFTAPECEFAIDYFGNWISIMTFPVILFVFAQLFSLFMTFLRMQIFNTPRKEGNSHVHQILGIVTTTLYFSYMKLTMTALEIFDCSGGQKRVSSEELDSDNGFGANVDAESMTESQYMSITNWECFDKNSKQVVLLPFAAVAIFVYGIGFPLYLVNILLRKRNRRRAREDQILRAQNLGSTSETNLRCYHFRHCYGCIYSMYKPEFWYWVIVVLVKKLILIVLSMSFQYHPILQLCSIIMIVLIFSAVQFSCYPMMSLCKKDNTVEKYQFDVNRLQNEIIQNGRGPNTSFDEATFLEGDISISSEGDVPKIVRKSRLTSNLQKKSRLLWDHNIVEVVLETIFVLICVLGIIFGSIEKESKLYEYTSYFAMGVIAFSLVYLVVVLCSEIFFFHLHILHWKYFCCCFSGLYTRFKKLRVCCLHKRKKPIVIASVVPEANNIEVDRYLPILEK